MNRTWISERISARAGNAREPGGSLVTISCVGAFANVASALRVATVSIVEVFSVVPSSEVDCGTYSLDFVLTKRSFRKVLTKPTPWL
jgi:hypothetical protein